MDYELAQMGKAFAMSRLERYLGKAVIAGTLMALLLLVSVATLIDFVNEMDDIGKQGYTYLRAILYILFTMPQRVYELFPFAMLLGSLISLGNLAANSEIVVMRATGISAGRIIGAAMKTGLIMTIAIMLLGEFVAPISEQNAKNLRNFTTNKQVKLSLRNGLWAKDGNRFLNIKDVFPNKRLGRVRIFEMDDNGRLREFIWIKSAIYNDNMWELSSIVRREISADGVKSKVSGKEKWSRLLAPDLFDVIVVKPKYMSASKLHRYVEYLKQNGLDSSLYELSFWTRFTIPLSGLVMVLIAMPFVFGSLRTGGAGQRLFIGVLIGVVFHLSYQAFINLGLVYRAPPVVAATFPLLMTVVVALFFVKRVR